MLHGHLPRRGTAQHSAGEVRDGRGGAPERAMKSHVYYPWWNGPFQLDHSCSREKGTARNINTGSAKLAELAC